MTLCGLCSLDTVLTDCIVCNGDCGKTFHINCAATKYEFDPSGSDSIPNFRCDPCNMQRSRITNRTPPPATSAQPSLGRTASKKTTSTTLDDVMRLLQTLTTSTNRKLGSIQVSLTNLERSFLDLRADVSTLATAHAELSKRVVTLETSSETSQLDIHGIREDNVSLHARLNEMATQISVSTVNPVPLSADLTITGIPAELKNSHRELVGKVLEALAIPELIHDVLDIRQLNRTTNPTVGEQNTQPPTTRFDKLSLLVTLKSPMVRDFIIAKKRTKKELPIADVFSFCNRQGSIYVNEFLPANIYNLLRRTKAKAAQAHFNYVWTRSGAIFVRKSDGQPTIQIRTDDDLSKLV